MQVLNSKSEILDKCQIPMFKNWELDIKYCFVFRISYLEFAVLVSIHFNDLFLSLAKDIVFPAHLCERGDRLVEVFFFVSG
jgi:hypothetical protein